MNKTDDTESGSSTTSGGTSVVTDSASPPAVKRSRFAAISDQVVNAAVVGVITAVNELSASAPDGVVRMRARPDGVLTCTHCGSAFVSPTRS